MRKDKQISTSIYHLPPMKDDQLEKTNFFRKTNSGTEMKILQCECQLLTSRECAQQCSLFYLYSLCKRDKKTCTERP